jgi:hypothetical protein
MMFIFSQAGSSPVSSISGFSVGSGRVDEAVDDFKVNMDIKCKHVLVDRYLQEMHGRSGLEVAYCVSNSERFSI